jgi:putative transport protein
VAACVLVGFAALGAGVEEPWIPGRRIFEFLRAQPFVILFLVVAGGYSLGQLKLKQVSLGATASTLLLALLVSVTASAVYGMAFNAPDFVGSVFFNLYMFAVGMKVGPQFISGLKSDARNFILIGLLTPALAIGIALGLNVLFHLPPGVAVGIFGGANTATPGLGAARDAISSRAASLPAGVSASQAIGSMSTAFAFAYCVSTALFVLMLRLLPQLFKKDPVAEARALQQASESEGALPLPGAADAFLRRPIPSAVRVYQVEAPELDGHSVKALRQRYPLATIERIKHQGQTLEGTDEQILSLGDEVALGGSIEQHIHNFRKVGPEVSDPELADIGAETVDLVVRKPEAVGQTLAQFAVSWGHGLYLNGMFRGGEPIPFGPKTVLERNDVLRVTGSALHIGLLTEHAGVVVRSSLSTDIVTIACGVALGAALGALAIRVGNVRLSLGSAVGLLLVGIALSTLRTRNPALGGPFPEAARQLIEDLGLNVFAAVMGLNAGPTVLTAIRGGALLPIIIGAILIGLIPPFIAWLLGQYRLRMNTAILLGAVAGARCNSPGLRAAVEETKSSAPAISYPATFALSNITLTIACYMFGMYF